MTDEMLTAWAAGLFEGEGSITLHRAANRGLANRYMSLTLTSTDRDVVDRFHAVMGVGRVYVKNRRPKDPQHYKTAYSWQVAGRAAEEALLRLMPLLGERRQQRGAEVMAEVAAHRASVAAAVHSCPGCGACFTREFKSRRKWCSDRCRDWHYAHPTHQEAIS